MKKPKDDEKKKDLSATGIVRQADTMQVRLFHTPEGKAIASVYRKDHWENLAIKSAEFGEWLSSLCFHKLDAVPSERAIAEAKTALAGRAIYAGPETRVHSRLAGHGGAIYLDLVNSAWEMVKITSEGWEVVSSGPVRFVRSPGMQPLPHPVKGGKIDDLRPFLNLTEDHWRLAVSWLIGALRPTGPYPLLVVGGSHGSAKSTASKMLRALIDPNQSPLRGEPTNPRDLAISADNSWCLGFDNFSTVRSWLSDALCRIYTGGGFATRTLYTDSGEQIFEAKCPVLLNGIDIVIGRPDLSDRCIFLSLSAISEEERKTEAEVWAQFEVVRPYVLGCLLDAVACALRRLTTFNSPKLPRMADFAKWVSAAEPALSWPEGSFLEAYRQNRMEANAIALETSLLSKPITYIADHGPWEGTATQLQAELDRVQLEEIPVAVGEATLGHRTPREVSHMLRRLVPNFQEIGIKIEFGKTPGDNSTRVITIQRSAAGGTNNGQGVSHEAKK
jgi:putative DNA primase/helicase